MEARTAILSCAMTLLLILPLGSAASVTRGLSSGTVSPGGTLTVTLSVDVDGEPNYYAIDEIYPSGWEVIDSEVGSGLFGTASHFNVCACRSLILIPQSNIIP